MKNKQQIQAERCKLDTHDWAYVDHVKRLGKVYKYCRYCGTRTWITKREFEQLKENPEPPRDKYITN